MAENNDPGMGAGAEPNFQAKTPDEILREVLNVLDGRREQHDGTGQYSARCPAHDDAHQSFRIKPGSHAPVVFFCHAECKAQDIFDALERLGIDRNMLIGKQGISLQDLAVHKRIPYDFLRSLGIKNKEEGKSIAIPYWKADYAGEEGAKPARVKLRFKTVSRKGDKGIHAWDKNYRADIKAYGLWKLKEWLAAKNEMLFIVEGESNCWAGWYHDLPFIGVPGGKNTGCLEKFIFDGINHVIICEDPDKAGKNFVYGVESKLAEFLFAGDIKIIEPDALGVKDPSEFHIKHRANFKQEFLRLALAATPIAEWKQKKRKPITLISFAMTEDEKVKASERFMPAPGTISLSEAGNAKRMILRNGENFRWVEDTKSFLVWDGRRWTRDKRRVMWRHMTDVIYCLGREAEATPDNREGRNLKELIEKHALRSEDSKIYRGSIEHAKGLHEAISAMPGDFDTNPFLLNVHNGTIDLRTGTLMPHLREDYLTMMANVAYDHEAQCPKFISFLNDIMNGDQDLINYIQIMFGMSMTGDVSEDCLFFCYGTGANGKTTLIETLAYILGDYAIKADVNIIMAGKKKDARDASPEIAKLKGKRFVSTTEVEQNGRFDVAAIKSMTGKDTMVGRPLFENSVEFPPQFKIWMYGNYKPIIHENDPGTWRRLKMLPFLIRIPSKRMNRSLRFELLDEAPGILNWGLSGTARWLGAGLVDPPQVSAFGLEYRNEQDQIQQFINERCSVSPELSIGVRELYMSYRRWIDNYKRRFFLTESQFGAEMDKRSFKKERRKAGMIWIGISYRQDDLFKPPSPSMNGSSDGEPVIATGNHGEHREVLFSDPPATAASAATPGSLASSPERGHLEYKYVPQNRSNQINYDDLEIDLNDEIVQILYRGYD